MEMVRRTMAMGKGELLMWTYNKTLQYPVNIKQSNPQLAKFIISQYGGADFIFYYVLYISSKIPSSLIKFIFSIII